MQGLALTVMLTHHGVPAKVLADLTFRLPALAAATALGVALSRRVDDVPFRRAALAVLLIAGLFLVV